ncbi:MAG: MMPL family transporter, partial [Actinomycetota bacterium]|nr:MMPL family transporter [Actinomycetota bacterium]
MSRRTPGDFFGTVAAAIARRARPVLIAGLLVALAAVVAAAGMDTQAVDDAIFDREADAYVKTAEADARFGEDPVVIMVKGDLADILTGSNIERMNVLEQCVSGSISRGRGELFKTCERLNEIDPVQVFTGPATFLGRAVAGITGVYEEQLKQLEKIPEGTARASEANQQLLLLGTQIIARYGLTSLPSLDDPAFINRVVYGEGGTRSGPKPRLSYLFPNSESAQIVLRLRSDLTDAERSETIDLIRRATKDESTRLEGAGYVVSGSPVIFEGLADAFETGVLLLAAVAVVLMSIALSVGFGSAWRLLPLLLALASIVISFGILRLFGGSISLAALGVAPILIGLTVDYAVQIQARFDEVDHQLSPGEAARLAASGGLPMIATACLASAAGFAALFVSPVPLISEFGLLLSAGVLICLLVVFVLGFAILAIRGPGMARPVFFERFGLFAWVRHGAKSALGLAIVAPGRLLLISLAIAACGWVAGTQAKPATEISQLLPARSAAAQDLNDLKDTTGTAGEIDVIVRAPDVTAPRVVAWMDEVRTRALAKAGYAAENPDCEVAELCPGPAIPDFVGDAEGLTAAEVKQGLRNLPESERSAIIAGGLTGGESPVMTKLPFVIRAGSVDRQRQVIDWIEEAVAESRRGQGPPPGTTAELTGMPVVITTTVEDLAASRYLLVGLALLGVALVLLLVYRSVTRVVVPLVPIVVAGGWSALIVSTLDISLNPLSAVLAVLVTAIATEFSV